MKNLLIIILLGLHCFKGTAQKNDYVWLQGYEYGFSPTSGLEFCTTIFDFNSLPRTITYDLLGIYFDFTNTGYSDSNGNLLLYTKWHILSE